MNNNAKKSCRCRNEFLYLPHMLEHNEFVSQLPVNMAAVCTVIFHLNNTCYSLAESAGLITLSYNQSVSLELPCDTFPLMKSLHRPLIPVSTRVRRKPGSALGSDL